MTMTAWAALIGTLIVSRRAAYRSDRRALWRRCLISNLILTPLTCISYCLVCLDDSRNGLTSYSWGDAAFLVFGLVPPAPLAYFAWHQARSAHARIERALRIE